MPHHDCHPHFCEGKLRSRIYFGSWNLGLKISTICMISRNDSKNCSFSKSYMTTVLQMAVWNKIYFSHAALLFVSFLMKTNSWILQVSVSHWTTHLDMLCSFFAAPSSKSGWSSWESCCGHKEAHWSQPPKGKAKGQKGPANLHFCILCTSGLWFRLMKWGWWCCAHYQTCFVLESLNWPESSICLFISGGINPQSQFLTPHGASHCWEPHSFALHWGLGGSEQSFWR